jgi:hypothetical protein
MSSNGYQRFSVRPEVIRNFGITLFALSFIIPSGGAHVRDYLQPFSGYFVFIQTPVAITFLPLFRGPPIDDGFTPYEIFIRVILIGAWLASFTVFFKLPRLLALVAIGLPWLAFIFWFEFAARFIPFYFWALGITFIHLSRIFRSWNIKVPTPLAP